MKRPTFVTVLSVLVVAGVVGSLIDLRRAERETIIVYTTPALRDLLENEIFPRFEERSGLRVLPLYLTAGEEFNRLRLSGDHTEADVFLHASPLYLEKAFAEGRMDPLPAAIPDVGAPNQSARGPDGRLHWAAFAWSPLVEVYAPSFTSPPDIVRDGITLGIPHPRLSNNGLYNVIVLEEAAPNATAGMLARTVVQPTNARTTIGGVADGSFQATLGYEAVASLYAKQGAQIRTGPARIDGKNWTTPVLFCVGLVTGHPHREAEEFVEFLFEPQEQARFERRFFRPMNAPPLEAANTTNLHFDWRDWESLENTALRYEVKA